MHKMRFTASAALIAAVLAGCTVGPDYHRPEVDTPAQWRLNDAASADLANTAWWEQLGDPVLNDLIASALKANKDLLIASARVDEFAGRYGFVRSSLFPQAGIGYSASRERVDADVLTGSGGNNTFNSYNAVLNASWEIDFFGRIRRQTEAAKAQVIASEEARRAVVLSLVGSVAGAYVNLRSLDQQLEIAQATAKTRGESYEIFKLRYEGGIISLLELSQSRSQYEEALATIPVLQKSIAQQENGINFLLGRNPGPVPRGKPIDELALPGIPAGLPSDLLTRRPDVLDAEQQLVAANAQIGAAKALYYPTISLTGLLGTSSTQMSDLFDPQTRVWKYSAGITMPIFTAGAIAGQVEAAEARQQQALFNYQKVIQQSFREVDDALVDQDRTRAQLTAQKRQVAALKEYYETANLRYENGYTSYIEVLDAERSLFNAKLQYTQSQQVQLQAMVNLYKAMGGGWVSEADKLTKADDKRG